MTKISLLVSLVAMVALFAAESSAQALDGGMLFMTKTCIACHGPEGKAPLLPVYPKLAGQNKDYMLQQMKDIKSGKRNNGNSAAMKGVMPLVNDAEMEAIAAYLSQLK